MNISDNKREIPGFYRDPVNGRYFRHTDINLPLLGRVEEKRKREYIIEANKKPRKLNIPKQISTHTSFLKLLSSQENGMTSSINFKSEFLKLKTRQMLFTKEFRINIPNVKIVDCHFVRASHGKIVGIWESERGENLVSEVIYENNSTCSKLKTMPSVSMIDSQRLYRSTSKVNDIFYVHHKTEDYITYTNSSFGNGCCVMMIKKQNGSGPYFLQHSFFTTPLWCCANTITGRCYALGGENIMYIYVLDKEDAKKKTPGNVFSIEFNKESNLVYCGLHTGKLLIYDRRASKFIRKIQLLKGAICDTLLLSDQQSLLVSGVFGNLLKVDFRMNRKVLTYPGHITASPKKISFSVDERANILCATGSDNLTRLWSLNRGDLLFSLVPPNQSKKARSCLMSWNEKWFVNLFQKGKVMIYEP